MNLRKTEDYRILGVFLAVTGALAAVILAVFAQFTDGPIREAKQRITNQALGEILPPFDNVPSTNTMTLNSPNGWPVTFYGALENGKLVGVAATAVTPNGYAGNIKILLAFQLDGSIRAMKSGDEERSAVLVTEQTETPGLGTKVCERKNVKTIFSLFESGEESGLAGNKILDQFAGKIAGASPWMVQKDGGEMLYVTGATVTSRAVTTLVYQIAETYQQNLAQINAKLAAEGK